MNFKRNNKQSPQGKKETGRMKKTIFGDARTASPRERRERDLWI
jgi:hypothetical protein